MVLTTPDTVARSLATSMAHGKRRQRLRQSFRVPSGWWPMTKAGPSAPLETTLCFITTRTAVGHSTRAEPYPRLHEELARPSEISGRLFRMSMCTGGTIVLVCTDMAGMVSSILNAIAFLSHRKYCTDTTQAGRMAAAGSVAHWYQAGMITLASCRKRRYSAVWISKSTFVLALDGRGENKQ